MFVIIITSPINQGLGEGQQFIRIQSHIYFGTPAVLIFLLGTQ